MCHFGKSFWPEQMRIEVYPNQQGTYNSQKGPEVTSKEPKGKINRHVLRSNGATQLGQPKQA